MDDEEQKWASEVLRRLHAQHLWIAAAKSAMEALTAENTTEAEQQWARAEAERLVAEATSRDDQAPAVAP